MEVFVLLIGLTATVLSEDLIPPFSGNCTESPCRNFGFCYQVSQTLARCVCPFGYTGTYCERLNCLCMNGGVCKFVGKEKACTCIPGFYGRFCENSCSDVERRAECETKRRFCKSDTCFNGGTCIDEDVEDNEFRCECEPGFTGDRCEAKTDVCEPSSCENGSTCFERNNGFDCLCQLGYNGERCQNKDDKCQTGLCLNGGVCAVRADSFSCMCSDGFTGVFCQNRVDVGIYNETDILKQKMCVTDDCHRKAGDGVCDPECNHHACDYDGGDCSAKVQPFDRCPAASFCAHSFHDQKCDKVCNVEECLFDGYDCDNQVEKCLEERYCAEVFGNGKCDLECNNSECGWDGGDCEPFQKLKTALDGDVILTLLLSKEEFLKRKSVLLMVLSQKLKATVHVKLRDGEQMVYEWNSSCDIELLKSLLENEFLHQAEPFHPEKSGTLVVLTVDVSNCQKEDGIKCFGDIVGIVSYLGAATAKQILDGFDAPIYAAIANFHSERKSSVTRKVICFTGILIFCAVFVIVGQVKKRKIVSAPIWYPPTEAESRKTSTSYINAQTTNHYSEFNPPKQMHFDFDRFFSPSDSGQSTVLHLEAASQSPVNLPIHQGIVNEKDRNGRTALMLLLLNDCKREEVVIKDMKELLNAGADINAVDGFGDTALLSAVKGSHHSLVKFLLSKGADPKCVDNQDKTLLHHAVAVCSTELVQILLGSGVDVNAWDSNNRTALVYSAKYTFEPKIATILLDSNADHTCVGDRMSLNYDGRTAAHFAAQLGNVDVLKVLIDYGANKDVQDIQGQTPLFLAAIEGQFWTVKLLLEYGASKHICDEAGRMPRDVAAGRYHVDIVELLGNEQPIYVGQGTYSKKTNSTRKVGRRPKLKKKKMEQKDSYGLSNLVESVLPYPMTPQFPDKSNFSTTPSPNSFCANMQPPALANELPVPGSTFYGNGSMVQSGPVLLPLHYADYEFGDWRPQGNFFNTAQTNLNWPCMDYPYNEQQISGNSHFYSEYQCVEEQFPGSNV